MYRFAVLTVSDSCYQKQKQDKSGPALEKCLIESFPGSEISKKIIPDDVNFIEKELLELCLNKYAVVLTTGGTGLSDRDVTPEATLKVISKQVPGISFAMLEKSLQVTEMAMLSRAICGIRGQTLIVNLPGSAKGATECFHFIKSSFKHAIDLLTNKHEEIQKTHQSLQFSSFSSSSSKVEINRVAARNRESPYKMLEVTEAIDLILHNTDKLCEPETIKIENALNRILAEDVYTSEPFPLFRASIKDGYAVKTEDGTGVRIVRATTAAGDDPNIGKELDNGEVVRISTGAAVPSGSDAVVQVEDTELIESETVANELKIKIKVAPIIGQDIREIGSDIQAGELVLEKFTKMKASHIGVLALIGRSTITVYRRPSIGVLSTGNELQRHDEESRPGHIRDSNKLTLLNLLVENGYAGCDLGIARDEPNCVKAAFENAFRQHDFVVTTGGVSMGEFDLIKEVLSKDFGATIHFGRINMKPGKPTTFATCTYEKKTKLIFALPGNPVSANVTGLLFLIPAIRSFECQTPHELPRIYIITGEDVNLDPRPEYRRVRLEREGDDDDRPKNRFIAHSTGNQISSRLNSFVGAHALAILPSSRAHGSNIFKKGANVRAIVLDLNI